MESWGLLLEEKETLEERDRKREFLRERWGLGEELEGSLQSESERLGETARVLWAF